MWILPHSEQTRAGSRHSSSCHSMMKRKMKPLTGDDDTLMRRTTITNQIIWLVQTRHRINHNNFNNFLSSFLTLSHRPTTIHRKLLDTLARCQIDAIFVSSGCHRSEKEQTTQMGTQRDITKSHWRPILYLWCEPEINVSCVCCAQLHLAQIPSTWTSHHPHSSTLSAAKGEGGGRTNR